MVEEHSPEFIDIGEKQKIDFFEGDVHLGHYDFRFDFNDKKHFSISRDGTGRVRVHSQKNISFIKMFDIYKIYVSIAIWKTKYK